VLTRLGARGPRVHAVLLTRELSRLDRSSIPVTGGKQRRDGGMSYLLRDDDPARHRAEISPPPSVRRNFRTSGAATKRFDPTRFATGSRAWALKANATRFSSSQNFAQIVGRTPGSARVPLDPLLASRINLIQTCRPARGPAADRGVRPTILTGCPVLGKTNGVTLKAVCRGSELYAVEARNS
jgi:hypothetical protein